MWENKIEYNFLNNILAQMNLTATTLNGGELIICHSCEFDLYIYECKIFIFSKLKNEIFADKFMNLFEHKLNKKIL